MPKNRSELERSFETWWQVLAPPEAPQPEREVKLIPGRKFRCDFVWGDPYRLVVEVDGGQWAAHGGRHNTDQDRAKINLLTLHGYRVLRYSGEMIKTDPGGVIGQVCEALGIEEGVEESQPCES